MKTPTKKTVLAAAVAKRGVCIACERRGMGPWKLVLFYGVSYYARRCRYCQHSERSDCIAGKLNQTRRKQPRKNTEQLQSPDDALTQGMAVALAEMHRLHGDSSGVCEVARAAGLTIENVKKAGTDGYDWKELGRAGVPRR